eukprot:4139541-Lingulodinium_polyedra.AAC.1
MTLWKRLSVPNWKTKTRGPENHQWNHWRGGLRGNGHYLGNCFGNSLGRCCGNRLGAAWELLCMV